MRALVRLARNGLLGVTLSVTTLSVTTFSVTTLAVTSIPQPAYAFGWGDIPWVHSFTHNTLGLIGAGLGIAAIIGGAVAIVLSAPVWVPVVLIGGGLVLAGLGFYKLFNDFFNSGTPKLPGLPGTGPSGNPTEPPAPVPTTGNNGGTPLPQPPAPTPGGGHGGNGGGAGFPTHGPQNLTPTPGAPAPTGSNVGRFNGTTPATVGQSTSSSTDSSGGGQSR